MKKLLVSIVVVLFIASCSVANLVSKKDKTKHHHFTVDGQNVYFQGSLVAVYQAKTFSLDNGELVEEYNLRYVGPTSNKQSIGDLIDFVSDRHNGAEVEIEIDPKTGDFNL